MLREVIIKEQSSSNANSSHHSDFILKFSKLKYLNKLDNKKRNIAGGFFLSGAIRFIDGIFVHIY